MRNAMEEVRKFLQIAQAFPTFLILSDIKNLIYFQQFSTFDAKESVLLPNIKDT